MARKAAVIRPPSPFETMAHRVRRLITAPRAQSERQVTITRLEDESAEDWSLLLEQISEEDSVSMRHLEGSSVHLAWQAPRPD